MLFLTHTTRTVTTPHSQPLTTSGDSLGTTKYRVVQYNECSSINGATHPPCRLDRYPYTVAQTKCIKKLLETNPNLTAQGLVNQLQAHNSGWVLDLKQVPCMQSLYGCVVMCCYVCIACLCVFMFFCLLLRCHGDMNHSITTTHFRPNSNSKTTSP